MPDADWKTRALDVALVGVTAPVWGPIMAGCAIACGISQGRPILFTQARVGRSARLFQAFKFRTMIRDADSFLDADGRPTRSRVTPLGSLLRRTGLDELPQLFNVVRGDMSLVGPRPVLPEWVEKIPGGSRHPRFRVRPGLTGLAQIEGRNTVLWSRRLELDSAWAVAPTVGRYVGTILRTPIALMRPTVSADRNQDVVNDLEATRGSE